MDLQNGGCKKKIRLRMATNIGYPTVPRAALPLFNVWYFLTEAVGVQEQAGLGTPADFLFLSLMRSL